MNIEAQRDCGLPPRHPFTISATVSRGCTQETPDVLCASVSLWLRYLPVLLANSEERIA